MIKVDHLVLSGATLDIESRVDGFAIVPVLNLDEGALLLTKGEQLLNADWIGALDGLVPNHILLEDAHAAALAHDSAKGAIVKLVRAQNQLIVRQLIVALLVVALETDLVQVLLLNLVELFEIGIIGALARCGK